MSVGRHYQDVARPAFEHGPVDGEVVARLHGRCHRTARDVSAALDGADRGAEIADPARCLMQGGDVAARKAGEDVLALLDVVLGHVG